MKIYTNIIVFLIINFGALAIGNWLMADGPQKEWYAGLNKAPWTPPGWVFGFAWFTIMICFSIYMGYLFKLAPQSKMILPLFIIQFILNVSWNYVFFNQHLINVGFIVILSLTVVVSMFIIMYKKPLGNLSLLVLPYFLWLLIATSLNGYILLKN